jgi:hypothetical protein
MISKPISPKGRIVILGLASRIVCLTRRNDNYHSRSCSSEKNAVGVLLIDLPLRFVDVIPTSRGAAEDL